MRVVEQNRGRDMSSLFITFRDRMLSGEYAWVLRLHSKRTPQMPWQIGQSFKQHLIENLAPSRRFVASLFDLLEQPEYRNVGVVAPPVVHIGFGTLGHSWYSNRKPLEKLAKETEDQTCRWIRILRSRPMARCTGSVPRRLEPMFRHDWKWEDYNAEPNHTDGGLAHVQERLHLLLRAAARVQVSGGDVGRSGASNYQKLEYKHQIMPAAFLSASIR